VATLRGTIKAISISKRRGTKKTNVDSAELKTDLGIVGDAHAGNWHRQVSLLASEAIEKAGKIGMTLRPGDFAENITTDGIDLDALKIGSRLKLGKTAEIEITQFGKNCHGRCEIFKQLGECIMPRRGVFARVIKGGNINIGDTIEVVVGDD